MYSPMTRIERIANGEKLTPKTRKEAMLLNSGEGSYNVHFTADIGEDDKFTVTAQDAFTPALQHVLKGKSALAVVNLTEQTENLGIKLFIPLVAVSAVEGEEAVLVFAINTTALDDSHATVKTYELAWKENAVTLDAR